MEEKYRNKIYDRLLSISITIEMKSFPDPQYINEKIGECHVFIDEVERYSIQTSKEISINQQAENNAIADYEVKKENLLINNEDIKSLPNIRDREAKANSMLKNELRDIRDHKNTLTDLNNLLKAINLKNKNLNRVNTDIKLLIRVLESQIKLGITPATDKVMKSLIDEMDKTESDTDTFEDVESEVIEEKVVDPTTDLDIDDLLSTGQDSTSETVEAFEAKPTQAVELTPEAEVKLAEEGCRDQEEGEVAEPKPKKIIKDSPKAEDPTANLNIDDFFSSEPDYKKALDEEEPTIEESEKSLVDKGLIDPIPNFDETSKDPVIVEDTPVIEEDWPFDLDSKEEDTKPEDTKSESKATEITEAVDLDSVIDFKEQEGGKPEQKKEKLKKEDKTDNTQKEGRQQKEEIGIDIDDFLNDITIK